MAEFASKGVAGSGLGLGIAGTALGLLNNGGILGGLFNNGWNYNCGCTENTPVNRYDLSQESRISKLERQIKTLDTRIQKLESVSNEINDNIYIRKRYRFKRC